MARPWSEPATSSSSSAATTSSWLCAKAGSFSPFRSASSTGSRDSGAARSSSASRSQRSTSVSPWLRKPGAESRSDLTSARVSSGRSAA